MIRIVMGPPCGGKSTYVSEHAEKGDLIIDYDLIAKALGAPISHAADGIIKQAAFDARESAILRALSEPKENAWIIHTSPTEEHIKRYEAVGAEFVELDPGRETCLERAKQTSGLSRLMMALKSIMLRRKENQKCYTKP